MVCATNQLEFSTAIRRLIDNLTNQFKNPFLANVAMLTELIGFLVMLNPFALFLYLEPVMQELDDYKFRIVLTKATLISLAIFMTFFLTGDFVFTRLFRIDFESFRLFGGIIIFSLAYLFVVRGGKGLIIAKENLDDLASEIALPFMVGAGTISLSVLMSRTLSMISGLFTLVLVMIAVGIIILVLKAIRDHIKKKPFRVAFDKVMSILLRLNSFFVGAIGIDMIVVALMNMGVI